MIQPGNRTRELFSLVPTHQDGQSLKFYSLFECKVIGLLLFNPMPQSYVSRFMIGNLAMVIDPIPVEAFKTDDVLSFDEVNAQLESKKLPMLRRQVKEEVIRPGSIVTLELSAPCDRAAIWIERMNSETALYKVDIKESSEKCVGTIYRDGVGGFYPLWEIEAADRKQLEPLLSSAIQSTNSPRF